MLVGSFCKPKSLVGRTTMNASEGISWQKNLTVIGPATLRPSTLVMLKMNTDAHET
eukprot:CAMPEP_0180490756 /NCGR_PEP_ID=MMETSP1036_2-20121128/39288_1 /TAXON_ID=632150 /ORGANISM="Azadinium spinosum, Strain 3D9" /LENGTH=55 /DNA_ID=CAMNT_0022498977 /DNA_START=1 /DNA_END=168 /DNA_ORIENTATION=-